MYLLRRSAVGAGRAAANATAPVQYGDTTIVRRVDQRRVSYLDGASSLGVGSVGISPAWVAGASAVVSGLSFSTALCSGRNSVLSGSGASSTLLGASEVILRRYEHEAAGLVSS